MKHYWTDGSANPNPGPGGFAVIDEETHAPVALGRGERTSNIRMEGMALIAAIKLADGAPVCLHTDSEFWVNVLTKWAATWERHNWKKGPKANQEIKNLDLVMELWKLYNSRPVEIEWVRAHVGTKLNELADKWANRARNGRTVDGVELEVDEQAFNVDLD